MSTQTSTCNQDIINEFSKKSEFSQSIVHNRFIDENPASFVSFPGGVSTVLKEAYNALGIDQLYSHQAEVYEHAAAGRNSVVVTPTASGKTLCYNLPVLDCLIQDPSARALYLFPTKALSQDQQTELNTLSKTIERLPRVFTYDGDTPRDIRSRARDSGQIIISNPDMIHVSLLPNHTRWVKFYENLKYIVLDELHTYRGVFGSHVAGVLKRLERITAFYGSKPVYIASSATIANPGELAETLTGAPFELVDNNGAPRGRKHFIMYNPPFVDEQQGIRRSVIKEAARVAAWFLRKKVKTIIFARSRLNVELITTYLQKALPHRRDIASYRGGYLPVERRSIEKKVKSGEISCIVSTNALELGIDIGGLDVSIMAGYPNSIASTWQQSGRAGRRAGDSLAVMIGSSGIMDQYLMEHPDYLFSTENESALVDPHNLFIHLDQIKCASFEIPFTEREEFLGPIDEHLEYLEEHRVLHREGDRFYWSERSFPAEEISLRTATGGNFVIVDITDGKNKVIGEVDRPTAVELLFEEAIYMHRTVQYQVKKLDYEGRKAFVEERSVNYYTDAISRYEMEVLRILDETEDQEVKRHHLEVLVRRNTPKFKKIRYNTHENVGFGEIHLPEEEMHTTAVALSFAETFFAGMTDQQKEGVMLSIAYLMCSLSPLYLLCDRRDLGYWIEVKSPFFNRGVLYMYDNYPGGIGLSDAVYKKMPEILTAARDRVMDCQCENGCPSCIGPARIDEMDDVPYKQFTRKALERIMYMLL
jgi:DEAD/DEAH box helicase domain-containing protein